MKPAIRMLAMEKLREGDRSTRSEYGGTQNRRMIGYDREGAEMNRERRPQPEPYAGYPLEMRYGGIPDRIHRPPMDSYDREDEPDMRRRRDRRGRFMTAGMDDDDDDRPEARRRRDRRGRYAGYGMDDDDDDERPRMMRGNSYGDIYAEGTIYAPGANRAAAMGDMYAPVDERKAHEWVSRMHNADGTKGPHYKADQAEQIRAAQCPQCKRWDFFVALNMMYSDYCEVAKKMGMDKPDFYAHMAKAFLDDEDAGEHKLAKYMETIPE